MAKKIIAVLLFLVALPITTRTALVETELTYNVRTAKGAYPFAPYRSGVGQVNLSNGNLVFSRLLVTRPGRGGFNAEISLTYNSKIWSRVGSYMTVPETGSYVGLGWRIGFPMLVQGSSSYAVVLSDGSSHEIVDTGGGAWKSVDSSYILFDPPTKTATLKGGVKLIFGNTVGSTSYTTEMKDRNGNQIKATYVSGTGKLSEVQDTVGLLATFVYSADGMLQTIHSHGTSQGDIMFTYGWCCSSPTFSLPSQVPQNEHLLTNVTVRAGYRDLRQIYSYNSYSELQQIINSPVEWVYDPNCSCVRYLNDPAPPWDTMASYYYTTMPFHDAYYGSVEERLVTTKTEYVTNSSGNSYRQDTIAYTGSSTLSNPSQVTVTEYESASNSGSGQTIFNLYYTAGGRNWSDGLVHTVQRLASPSGPTLRSQENTWTQDNTALSFLDNPRQLSQTITLDNGQSTRTDYAYSSDGTGNISQVSEYGFSNELIRRTTTTYFHETNPVYAPLNLTNLPASVSVTNSTGTEVSRTEFTYDDYPLTSYSTILNHDPAYNAAFTTRGNQTSVRRLLKDAAAPPGVAPTAVSQPATGVQYNAGTLNASVNPNGSGTTVFFHWGTTTSYGNVTASTSIGAGTNPVSVAASLTGLMPSTTYHFRVVAINGIGTTYGVDTAFTTTDALAHMISPTPGSTLQTTPVTFTWSSGGGSSYQLLIGTSIGASNIYSGAPGVSLSATVNLPIFGFAVYARLGTLIGSTWYWIDYTYTTTDIGLAKMVSPGPGSYIAYGTTFSWTGGYGTSWGIAFDRNGPPSFNNCGWWYRPVNTTQYTATEDDFNANYPPILVRLITFTPGGSYCIDYFYETDHLREEAKPLARAPVAGPYAPELEIPASRLFRSPVGPRYITTSAHYDIAGNTVSTMDALGHSTTTSYALDTSYAYPATLTNAAGHLTQYAWSQYYDGLGGFQNGNLQSVIDRNGVVTSQLSYDTLGRKTQEITPSDTRNFSYDDLAYLATSYSSSGWGYATTNLQNQVVDSQHSDPGSANTEQTASYTSWGQPLSQSVVSRAGTPGDASSYVYTYDALGRVTTIRTPYIPGTASYGWAYRSYSGPTTTVTDPDGKTKAYVYDAKGRISKVKEPDAAGNLTLETNYSYDSMGRLIQIVQGVQTRTFAYDSLGRLAWESHPESGLTAYTYDDNGNLLTKTDAAGVVTTIAYDALNRPTSKSYSDGTPAATFSYDQTSSNLIANITNSRGRQTSAWTSDGIGYSWSYDPAGRVLQQVFQIDGVNYPITYDYTDSGCGCPAKDLHSITYPNGNSAVYTRDDIGRVRSITGSSSGGGGAYMIQNVSYNSANGAVSGVNYYSASDTYSFDPTSGQLVGKTVANGSGHRTWSYHYTNAGRISEIQEGTYAWTGSLLGFLKYDYSYDNENRLGSMIRFHQDENENWITDSSAGYAYDRYANMLNTPFADSNTNRILNSTYNSAGRLLADGTNTYSYNALGLLTQVNAGQRGLYRYDALGRRVKRTWNYSDSGGQHYGSSIYVFGPDGNIMAEYTNEPSSSGCPSSVVDNVVMNGTIVSRWVTGTGDFCSNGAHPVQRNHLNQVLPSDLTDLSFSPYSHPFGSGGSDQFPGQKDDPESSLKDFGARYYNPAMARWTSPDSIMSHTYDPQSLNKYAYVRNDPINNVDPDGKSWWSWIVAIGRAITTHSGSEADNEPDPIPPYDIGNGNGPGGKAPNPCDRKNEKNKKYLDFIAAHKKDATDLASQMGVPVEYVLGVSMDETGFGTSDAAVNDHNWFGLHASSNGPFLGQVDSRWTNPPPPNKPVEMPIFTAERGFLDSGQVFVDALAESWNKISNMLDFAQLAHSHSWGAGKTTEKYTTDLISIISDVQTRLKCP